jgi:hypothetical protein
MEEEGLAAEEEYMKPAPPVTRMFLGEYSVPMLPATHDTKDVWCWHLLLFPRCHGPQKRKQHFQIEPQPRHHFSNLKKNNKKKPVATGVFPNSLFISFWSL